MQNEQVLHLVSNIFGDQQLIGLAFLFCLHWHF